VIVSRSSGNELCSPDVVAIGAAIQKQPGEATHLDLLIPRAVIRDRDTFFDATHADKERELGR
jgi:hypothetical protein